jgi:uncharacterized protein YukE
MKSFLEHIQLKEAEAEADMDLYKTNPGQAMAQSLQPQHHIAVREFIDAVTQPMNQLEHAPNNWKNVDPNIKQKFNQLYQQFEQGINQLAKELGQG